MASQTKSGKYIFSVHLDNSVGATLINGSKEFFSSSIWLSKDRKVTYYWTVGQALSLVMFKVTRKLT